MAKESILAAQKKKTVRKTSKTKPEQVEGSGDRSLGAMVLGYGLIAVAAIALLSCISVVYVGSEKGIMTRFGDFLNFAFGKLPVIFIILSVMLWGLFISFQGLRQKLFRVALGLSIVGLDLCVLMSIPVHGKANVSEDVFIMRGGIVGRFLDSNVVGPLCGDVLFADGFGAAAKRGVEAHARFEKIEWLDGSAASSALERELVKPSADAKVWRERAYELFADGRWESGQFDRVVFWSDAEGRRAKICDYKTNAPRRGEGAGEFALRMRDTYMGQMLAYRRALSSLCGLPQTRIELKLLLVANGDVVELPACSAT